MEKKRMALIIVLLWAFAWVLFADTARFGALVVDAESGIPLEGVPVEASFSNDNGWKAWTESAPINHDSEPTDRNGRCRLGGKTNIGRAGCWVDDPPHGYYGGGGRSFRFKWKNLVGIWQPDNLVATIRLQRVEHPIPLFVKKVSKIDWKNPVGGFDGTNAVLRYDLIKGDWLPPDGNGEVADMEIKSAYRLVDVRKVTNLLDLRLYEFENRIVFPEAGNGILEQMSRQTEGLKLRKALPDGYAQEVVRRFGMKGNPIGKNVYGEEFTDADENRVCVFRIRSRIDEHGNVLNAYYGKVHGDFRLQGDWKVGFRGVEFLYYLNPTPLDRNLEWDMKTNLCPNPGNLGERRP